MTDNDNVFVEKTVETSCRFQGRILRLEVDTVELPGGDHSIREVVRHPGAAVMIPVTAEGRVIFVRQYRYPTGEVLLELPAGKLDPGEAPEECAARETAEETGWLPAKIESLGAFYTAPGFSDELIHAYLVTDLRRDHDATSDADELVEAVELSLRMYDRMLAAGEIRDAKTIAAVSLWRARSR